MKSLKASLDREAKKEREAHKLVSSGSSSSSSSSSNGRPCW